MVNIFTPIKGASRSFLAAFITKWEMFVLDVDTGKFLEYFHLRTHPKLSKIWNESYSNEMGRSCQGVITGPNGAGHRIKGTDTFHFIDYENIPMDHRKEIT